jgi:DNA-binding NarL/FixJ family response regulator
LDENGKTVHQAIWSGSPFLAWIQYGNMAQALLAAELERMVKRGASQEELLEAIHAKQNGSSETPAAIVYCRKNLRLIKQKFRSHSDLTFTLKPNTD